MVYSADGISRAEAYSAQKVLAALLSYNMKREYSEMCGFLKVRMSLAIVRSKSLLLCSPRAKGACIWQLPELTDGSAMVMLVPWKGLNQGETSGNDGIGQVQVEGLGDVQWSDYSKGVIRVGVDQG